MSGGENPKKEEIKKEDQIKPKSNLIAEKLKMMQGNDAQKKEENKAIRKISEQKEAKNELEKPKDEEKRKLSSIQERLKNLQDNKTTDKEIHKKEENIKPKEDFKNKFAERIKSMEGGNNIKKEEKKE